MQDCVIDAARDGSAAENRTHWKKKTNENQIPRLDYVIATHGGLYIWEKEGEKLSQRGQILQIYRKEPWLYLRGKGGCWILYLLCKETVIHHYPACPVSILIHIVFVKKKKKSQGLNRLLTLLKCHVRSLIKHEQLKEHAFLWVSLGF